MTAGVRIVDEALDVVIYDCECGKEVGSPMPRAMRCIDCRTPMAPKMRRNFPADEWRPYTPPPVSLPAQSTLFKEGT